MQALRRATEVKLFGNRNKVPQMTKFDILIHI
jgi:hypothetical protein